MSIQNHNSSIGTQWYLSLPQRLLIAPTVTFYHVFLDSIGQQPVAFEIASIKKKLHKIFKSIFICKEKNMMHVQSGVKVKKWRTFKIKFYASRYLLKLE